jgi:hypothetical protein
MSTADSSSSGERLYAAVAPLSPQDAELGAPLRTFCDGLGKVLAGFDSIFAPTDRHPDGLDKLLDPDDTPDWALPWLGMATGTKIVPGLSTTAQREAIKQTPAQDRGTAPAIIGAARRRSNDPVHYPVPFFAPYNGSVYEALLVVYQLTPEKEAALKGDLADVQPAWMLIHLRNDPGWSFDQFESAYAGRTVNDFQTDPAMTSVDVFERHIATA